MDIPDNARLTPKGRQAMACAVIKGGATKAEAATKSQ